jgi:hypothetical protein
MLQLHDSTFRAARTVDPGPTLRVEAVRLAMILEPPRQQINHTCAVSSRRPPRNFFRTSRKP